MITSHNNLEIKKLKHKMSAQLWQFVNRKSKSRSITYSDPERRSENESDGSCKKTNGKGRRYSGSGRGWARSRCIGGVNGAEYDD